MEEKIRIRVLNRETGDFEDLLIPQGSTIQSARVSIGVPMDARVQVNYEPVDSDYELKEGDVITWSHKKIVGG